MTEEPALSNDIALVTGGANGLGAVIAQALHGAGFRVAVGDLDDAAAAHVAGVWMLPATPPWPST